MLKNIIKNSPKEVDLTNEQHSEFIKEVVETILAEGYNLPELENFEDEIIKESIEYKDYDEVRVSDFMLQEKRTD